MDTEARRHGMQLLSDDTVTKLGGAVIWVTEQLEKQDTEDVSLRPY